jgi:UDP-N-acetylmuramate--alanine ligase
MFLTPNKCSEYDLVLDLSSRIHNVHLIGAAGIGMQGLKAWLAGNSQISITYSDKNILDGIPEDSNPPDSTDLMITSSAISVNHPQYLWAMKHNIPVIHRSTALKTLIPPSSKLISISGAHGKTTTTALIAYALYDETSFMVGGVLQNYKTSAIFKSNAPYCVIEADESDGSMLNLIGEIGLVTNLDKEHTNYYGSFDEYLNSMWLFIQKTVEQGVCYVHYSCYEHLRDLSSHTIDQSETLLNGIKWYGTNSSISPSNIRFNLDGTVFDLIVPWGIWHDVETKLIGQHMVENIVGAIAILTECGKSESFIREKIRTFSGVKKRGESFKYANRWFIQDYAHHPTEIYATIAAYRNIHLGKIYALWEPHKYSRLAENGLSSFKESFVLADEIWMTPVWSAGEEYDPDYSIEQICTTIAVKAVLETPKSIAYHILHNTAPGDLIIAMGAGQIYDIFNSALNILKQMISILTFK